MKCKLNQDYNFNTTLVLKKYIKGHLRSIFSNVFFARKQGLFSQLLVLTVTSIVTQTHHPDKYLDGLGVCRTEARQRQGWCSSGVGHPRAWPCILSGVPNIAILHFLQGFSKLYGLERNCLGRPAYSGQFILLCDTQRPVEAVVVCH